MMIKDRKLRSIIPNALTACRMMAIPAIVASFLILGSGFTASSLFLLSSLTDFLDGYLARTWSVQSKFGTMFDPIADKILVTSTIIMLIHKNIITTYTIIPALIIVCREIFVSGAREFFATLSIKIPVIKLSKVKTAIQMISIGVLCLNAGKMILFAADILFWISAMLTVWTTFSYMMCVKKAY